MTFECTVQLNYHLPMPSSYTLTGNIILKPVANVNLAIAAMARHVLLQNYTP
jgi:hypothetical protein